jgi:hypothetical protein
MASQVWSESVHGGLGDVVRRVPWWAASAAAHLAILVAAMSIGFATRPESAETGRIEVTVGPVEEIPSPIKLPPRKIDRNARPNSEPVINFPLAEPSTRNESDDHEDFEQMKGQRLDFISWLEGNAGGLTGKKVADRAARQDSLGVLGESGGAGRYGGEKGGRVNRRKEIVGPSEDAVTAGLRWLARHQSPDGRWSTARFDSNCRAAERCGGPGSQDHDVGLTGLALLAFLGAGYLPATRSADSVFEDPYEKGRLIRFADGVRQGLAWLRENQGPDGLFGREDGEFLYDHAIATLAMTEATWLSATPIYRDPARRGIDFLLRARNPGFAWRYGVRPGDNDTSVTGWCVMALKSAELAGLPFDPAAYDGVRSWLRRATGAAGVVGYSSPGDAGSTIPGVNDRWSGHPAMTAVGLLSRIFIDKKSGDPWMRTAAQMILRDLPAWDEEHRTIDFYYWYYASLAMFQLESGRGALWGVFNQAMKKALVPFQEGDGAGCRRGSWNPAVDRWGSVGGRVYATAINVLTLEVYYRYESVFTGGTRRKA